MNIIRNLLILILISVIGVGVYFGANLYMKNRAIKEINKIIEQEHLEGLVDYDDVNYDIISGSIALDNVKFYIQNNLTGQEVGKIIFKKATLKGDWNKNYHLSLKNMSFINLNPQFPPNLIDKKFLGAQSANFDITKSNGITTILKGNINDIRLKSSILSINKTKESNKDLKTIKEVIKIDSPINIKMYIKTDPKRKIVNIVNYELDYLNNFSISYSMLLKGVDIEAVRRSSKNLQQNPNNFMAIAAVMNTFMKIQPTYLKITLKNHGIVDRLLSAAAKQQKTTKQKIIKEQLDLISRTPVNGLEKPLENFITSKSKSFKIIIKNKNNLTVGNIAMGSKSFNDTFDKLDIEFSN
jgi:hypothetical protein